MSTVNCKYQENGTLSGLRSW